MKKYRAEQFLSITGSECGTEVEILQVVTFTVNPGCAETRLTPSEPPTVEDVVIRHFSRSLEIDLHQYIVSDFEESDAFKAWLLEEANEQELAAADEAADMRREDAMYRADLSEEA